MSRFDALIERATGKLSGDPELQLEVAHELRTHLEDSAAEYRAAGLSEEESAAKAAEAFGNPDEVAEKLLAANRKRILVRRITRVVAGLTLAPVAAAVAVSIGWGAITSLLMAIGLVGSFGWFKETGWGMSVERIAHNATFHAYQDAIDNLSPPRRFLFKGDSSLDLNQVDPFSTAKDLAERWPDDPVYAANYAALAIGHLNVGQWADGKQKWAPHDLAEALAILEHGQKLEPDNGYYPVLRAAMLMSAGSQEQYDPTDDSLAFDYTDAHGKEQTDHLETVQIVDRELFERGLASLHDAAGKPYVRSHAAELADRRLAALPAPSELSNEVVRVAFSRNEGVPFGNYYHEVVNRAGAFAIKLAADRQAPQARSALHDESAVIRLVAAGARSANEVLTAAGMHDESIAQRGVIDRRLGLEDDAKATRKRYEAELREWRALMARLWGPLERQRERAGILEDGVWSHPKLLPDPQRSAAGRTIDYSVADQIALAALAVLLAIAAIPLLPQLPARLRGRRVKTPMFIGWRRLLWIVLIGAGAPLLLYGIYAYATPLNGRSYGLLYTHSSLPVQYLALAAVMGGLLRVLTNRATRQRAVELGMTMPPADRGWVIVQAAIALILAALTIAYLATWRPADPNADPDRLSGRGVWELVLIFLLGTHALISLLSAGTAPLFESTENSTGFMRKLTARFPAWPLYAGLMASLTTSLWLAWEGLPAGTRGTATLLLLSITLSTAAVLAICIVLWLLESGRSGSSGDQIRSPVGTWRAAPFTFAAAAVAILLVGLPLLRHIERSSLEDFDQRLHLWDLEHSPYAQVQERLATDPG